MSLIAKKLKTTGLE